MTGCARSGAGAPMSWAHSIMGCATPALARASSSSVYPTASAERCLPKARGRGLKIKLARRMGDVYPLAIQFLAGGKVDVRSIVGHRVGLEEPPGVFAAPAADASGYRKTDKGL
jgi:threonine dehydrogenase-like Zn-dependent dehydrogenase